METKHMTVDFEPDSELIHTITKEFFSEEPSQYKVLSGGAENTNILIQVHERQYVIRILGATHSILGKRNADDLLFELQFMDMLSQNHLPVPSVIQTRNGSLYETFTVGYENRFVVCFEFVNGTTPESISQALANNIGETMAEIHNHSEQFKHTTQRNWPGSIVAITDDRIRHFEEQIDDATKILSPAHITMLQTCIDQYKKIRQKFDGHTLPKGAIHGDMKAENLKCDQDRIVGILDFDDCRESYFAEDIANTFVFNFHNDLRVVAKNNDNALAFLTGYEKIKKLSPEEYSAISFFCLARIIELILKDLFRANSPDDKYGERIKKYIQGVIEFPDLFSGNYLEHIKGARKEF